MSSKKPKLPSIKATSKGIAEDLKAIKEALSAKPKGASASREPKAKKKTREKLVTFHESDEKSPKVKLESSKASPNRPQRQRKPNSRYTDLISEIQSTLRKRNANSRSELSSSDEDSDLKEDSEDDELAVAVQVIKAKPKKQKQVKEPKAKKIDTTPKKRGRPSKPKPDRPPTPPSAESDGFSESDDGFDSDDSQIQRILAEKFADKPKPEPKKPKKTIAATVSRPKQDHNVAKPPVERHEHRQERHDRLLEKSHRTFVPALYGRGRRNPISAGRAVRMQAAAAAAITGTTTAPIPTTNRNATLDYASHHQQYMDDEDEVVNASHYLAQRSGGNSYHNHHQSLDRGQSPPRSTDDYGVGVYYEAASSREAASAAMALSEYVSAPQPVEQQQEESMLQQAQAYESPNHDDDNTVGGVDQNVGSMSYDDHEDEVPALVYGPGPRVITYHGEYYPLSPVPGKRRMSKYPRPRSHRYKPFSSSYRPPDVMRYRRQKRRLMGFQRHIRTLPQIGTDWSSWASRYGAQMQQGDETRDALAALRADGYGGEEYGSYGYENEWPTQRTGRDRAMYQDEQMAQGVYGELEGFSSYDNYNNSGAPQTIVQHRSAASAAPLPPVDPSEICQLPPDIAGDHCYIRPPYDPNAPLEPGQSNDINQALLRHHYMDDEEDDDEDGDARHHRRGGLDDDDEDDDDDDRPPSSSDEGAYGPGGAYGGGYGATATVAGGGRGLGHQQHQQQHAETPAAVLNLQHMLQNGHRRPPPPVTLKIGVSSVSVGGTSFADYSFAAVGRDA